MKRQKKEKDYWDEYKNYNLDSNSDKLDQNKHSLDPLNSDNKKEDVMENSEKKRVCIKV